MKARIVFFDSVAVELSVRRCDDGTGNIRGVYTKFLGRPSDPHLTFIVEARKGLYTPHFSAECETGTPFRHYLPVIPENALVDELTRFGDEMVRKFARTLEPADLDSLEREGWTVHRVNWKAVRRWMRPAARRGRFGEFRIDARTISSFVLHVVRTATLPRALMAFPADQPARAVLIRFDEKGDLQVRSLFHFPDGFGCRAPDGEIVLAHAPGWYVQPCAFADDAVTRHLVPADRLAQVRDEIRACLARYPRAGEQVDPSALPLGFAWILGFFSDDLLHVLLALRHEDIERRRRQIAA